MKLTFVICAYLLMPVIGRSHDTNAVKSAAGCSLTQSEKTQLDLILAGFMELRQKPFVIESIEFGSKKVYPEFEKISKRLELLHKLEALVRSNYACSQQLTASFIEVLEEERGSEKLKQSSFADRGIDNHRKIYDQLLMLNRLGQSLALNIPSINFLRFDNDVKPLQLKDSKEIFYKDGNDRKVHRDEFGAGLYVWPSIALESAKSEKIGDQFISKVTVAVTPVADQFRAANPAKNIFDIPLKDLKLKPNSVSGLHANGVVKSVGGRQVYEFEVVSSKPISQAFDFQFIPKNMMLRGEFEGPMNATLTTY